MWRENTPPCERKDLFVAESGGGSRLNLSRRRRKRTKRGIYIIMMRMMIMMIMIMMIMVKEGNASRFVVEKASLRLFVDGVRLGEYDAALGDFGFPLYGRVLAGQVRSVWMESDRKKKKI